MIYKNIFQPREINCPHCTFNVCDKHLIVSLKVTFPCTEGHFDSNNKVTRLEKVVVREMRGKKSLKKIKINKIHIWE